MPGSAVDGQLSWGLIGWSLNPWQERYSVPWDPNPLLAPMSSPERLYQRDCPSPISLLCFFSKSNSAY
jgi:hypothetical protein